MLYFDHNATWPLCAPAREAWLEAVERWVGNPSSPHRLGARADAAISVAREKLAAWLGCAPAQIVWTSGATEAVNAAFHHLACSGGEVWISAIEHPCARAAAALYFGSRCRELPVGSDGVLDLEHLRAALEKQQPSAVAVMAANNETGVLQPWEQVRALCTENGVPFLCDASQWLGRLPARGFGSCDFVAGCAHKFGGPQGVGFLKVPPNFRPLMVGGVQEEGRRAGTENVAGILSMVAALDHWQALMTFAPDAAVARQMERESFEHELLGSLPDSRILGAGADRLWNTVAAILPEQSDCRQRWVVKLDKLGFAVSTGSACASGKEKTSHVLAAMRVAPEKAGRVLRFSGSWETRTGDWQALLDGLRKAYLDLVK